MAIIQYLTKVIFEDGALETATAAAAQEVSAHRPMIVTDPGVAAAGLLDRLKAALGEAGVGAVYDASPSNPTEAACLEALALYRAERCDSLIALGGGSPIDLAKAVGVLAVHDGPLSSFAVIHGGVARIVNPLPPLIAIPTTAGTGSEVGRGALITLADHHKVGILSPLLVPRLAICDPTLTYGLPPHLTAGTGMDAVTHCVETYISTAYNPPADGIAIEGLRRAAGSLERAVAEGGDAEARREMMAAAMMGAMAFQKGLGGVHAMSHALGGLEGYKLHHGVLNAVLLPHVLAFNASVVGDRYAALGAAMGLGPGADLAAEIEALTGRIGLPTRLSEMGVDPTAIEKAAPLAEADHTNATNPRKATAEDYRRLMTEAL